MRAFGRIFGAAVLSVAAVFAAVPSAHAAIVSKSWDPALPNPPFAVDLSWTATMNFLVPQSCLDTSGFKLILGNHTFFCGSNTTPAISVFSAQVGIYDDNTGTIIDVLTFHPGVNNALRLLAVVTDVNDGLTNYLSLYPSDTVNGNQGFPDPANPAPKGLGNFDFRLVLDGSAAPILEYRGAGATTAWLESPAKPQETLSTIYGDNDPCDKACVQEKTFLKVGDLVFNATVVPEPASLPLVLLALTGVWALRRRS